MGGLLRMIRLLLVLFTLVGFLIFSYPFLVAQVSLGKKDPHARDLETIKVVRSVFKVLLKLAGVTVTVKGDGSVTINGLRSSMLETTEAILIFLRATRQFRPCLVSSQKRRWKGSRSYAPGW